MDKFLKGIEGMTILDVFFYAGPIVKLIFIYLVITLIAAIYFGIMRYKSKSPKSDELTMIGFCSLGVGILGAIYTGNNLYNDANLLKNYGLEFLDVLAPGLLEVGTLFFGGLLVLLVCTILNKKAKVHSEA